MTKGVRGVRSKRGRSGGSVPRNPYRNLEHSLSKTFSPRETWKDRKARLKKEKSGE